MSKLLRNRGAWVGVLGLTGLTYLFFRQFPLVASLTYGSLILWIILRLTRSWWRLRRQGYRLRARGRERFLYEELANGEVRRIAIEAAFMPKGKFGIYWPTSDAWRQQMPDWARDRRDEIFERIRSELGSRFGKCIETDRVAPLFNGT